MTTQLETNPVLLEKLQLGAVTASGFSDISILTGGIEAEGHGFFIDEKSIDGFMRAVLGKTLAAYLTHAGAMGDRLGAEIGMFSGFYRDGLKVRARQFNFLESFVQQESVEHSTLVELAKKYPDQLGISPVLLKKLVWVMGDGSEEACLNPNLPPAGTIRDMPSMRVMSVESCDFVKTPAANYSLFSISKIDGTTTTNSSTMSAETILLSKHTEAINAKSAELTALQTQHKDALAALETKHKTELAAIQGQLTDATGKLAQATESAKGHTAALAAMTTERDEALKYDMRKAGAPALEIALAAHGPKLPEAGKTDQENWEKYTALCKQTKDDRGNVIATAETPEAKAFKEKHLSRKK